jgi:hypothetical protein
MWFDLSEITSKAPSIFVTKATLNFKKISSVAKESDKYSTVATECVEQQLLMSASVDWRKEGYAGSRVPGVDPLPVVCGPGGCSVEVTSVVNNWVRGEEKGGDANYGFVIRGKDEFPADAYGPTLEPRRLDVCQARYGDFSLTVTYSFPTKKAYTPPDTYPLECRGTEALKIMDFDGPVPFRWVGFNFIPGTGPARNGLKAGQCSWLDRGMRAGEPARLAQPIEYTMVWNKELNSSDSYWTFNVYNAGDQLQATGAERTKRMFVPLLRTNYALAANRGKAFASTTHPGNSENYVNDGELTGAGNAVWLDDTLGVFPDYLEVRFDGKKTIEEIDVITRQDNLVSPGDPKKLDPSFGKDGYGITAYDVQYWDGSEWVTVASVVNNDKVWKKFTTVIPVTTDRIRIQINSSQDNAFSRVVEVEAWGK